jgi:hypothetical protein
MRSSNLGGTKMCVVLEQVEKLEEEEGGYL